MLCTSEWREMKQAKTTSNPTGRTGKPIILPPTTFEDAVRRCSTLPREAKQVGMLSQSCESLLDLLLHLRDDEFGLLPTENRRAMFA